MKTVKNLLAALLLLSGPVAFASGEYNTGVDGITSVVSEPQHPAPVSPNAPVTPNAPPVVDEGDAPTVVDKGDAPTEAQGPDNTKGLWEKVCDFANSAWDKSYGHLPGMSLKCEYPEAANGANRASAAFQNFAHNHATAVNRMKVTGALGTTAAILTVGVLRTYKLIERYCKTVAKKAKGLFNSKANKKPAPKAKANARPQVVTNYKGGRPAAPARGGCANGRCGR